MNTNQKTYVYENVEVILTNRVCARTLSSGKQERLVEITPANQMDGSWKKWVSFSILFTILE